MESVAAERSGCDCGLRRSEATANDVTKRRKQERNNAETQSSLSQRKIFESGLFDKAVGMRSLTLR